MKASSRLTIFVAVTLFALAPILQAEAPRPDAIPPELQQQLNKARADADQMLRRFEAERKAEEEAKRQAARDAAKKVASTPAEDLTIDDYHFTWHLVNLEELSVDLTKSNGETDLTVRTKGIESIYLDPEQAQALGAALAKTEEIQKKLTTFSDDISFQQVDSFVVSG